MNAGLCLLLNSFGKLVAGGSDEIPVQLSGIILVKRHGCCLPCLQVIPDDRRLGLVLELSWVLKMGRLDAHVCLACAQDRDGSNHGVYQERSRYHHFSQRISFPSTTPLATEILAPG